jgi:hypothetical protein
VALTRALGEVGDRGRHARRGLEDVAVEAAVEEVMGVGVAECARRELGHRLKIDGRRVDGRLVVEKREPARRCDEAQHRRRDVVAVHEHVQDEHLACVLGVADEAAERDERDAESLERGSLERDLDCVGFVRVAGDAPRSGRREVALPHGPEHLGGAVLGQHACSCY